MKKLFTSLMLMLFAVLTVNAEVVIFDFTHPEAYGYNEPATNSGTNLAVGDRIIEAPVVIEVTANANTPIRFWGGTNAIDLRAYKNSKFKVIAPEGTEITKMEFEGGAITNVFTVNDGTYDLGTWTGSASEVEVTMTGTAKFNSLTVTYEAPAAGWDGTVTTSLDGQTVTSLADFDNMTLTFPGAKSIEILGEEDCQYLVLQNENGSEMYGLWAPTMGSEYTINGNSITLDGFMPMEGSTIAIPAGTTKLYVEDYGTLVIDGKADYLETMEFNANIAAAVEPFMLTSVSNNGVLGNVVGVEASEQGVMYQFDVTATGKELSKGTATPTLSLMEDATVDFGAAQIVAYGAETAYIRFMTLQQPYFTQPGTYVLDIPEGTVVDAEGTPNAAVTVKWVIIQGNDPEPFAITGATFGGQEAGAEVEALSYMAEITSANAIVALNEGNITLTDADNQPVGGNAYVFGYEGEGGSNTVYARFTFDTEDHQLHTPGVYTLNVPAGMFKDAEGNLSEAYTASWTVVAPETQTINIETVEVGTVTDTSYGSNDVYYTATVKFAKPEGAVYAYSEGLHMELNGENTGVPFQFGQWGMIELEEGDEVTLVYKDNMIAQTDDASYEGDIRPAGSYVGETTIIFLDENQWEIEGVTAHFVGSIVLPNLNAVEAGLGEPTWSAEDGQLTDDQINLGVMVSFPDFVLPEYINPMDVTATVTASLFGIPEGNEPMPISGEGDDIDPGFGVDGPVLLAEAVEHAAYIEGGVLRAFLFPEQLELGNHYAIQLDAVTVSVGEEVILSLPEDAYYATDFVVVETPIPSIEAVELTTEDENIALNDHSGMSVETANGIRVVFANCEPLTATYAIDAINHETGDVIYSVASGALNRGYAAFDKEAKFISGYKYVVTVKGWAGQALDEYLEPIEPIVSAIYTINGASATGIVGEPVWGVERGQFPEDMANLGVPVSFPEVLLPGLVDANAVEATVSATLYGVPTGNEPMPISGEDELDDNMGVDGPVEIATQIFTLYNVGGEWSANLFAEQLEVYNHYAIQLNAVTFVDGGEIVAELEDAGAYSVEFDVVPAVVAPSFGGVAFNVEEGAKITVDDVHNLAIKMYFPDGTGFEGYAFYGDAMLVKQNAAGEWDMVDFAELYSEFAEDVMDAEFAPTLFAEALQNAVVGETYRVLAIDYALIGADGEPVIFESYEDPATAPYVTFQVVDVASGINTVKFNVTDVKYNLAGQRVNNAKGIVIMNGKKVVLK